METIATVFPIIAGGSVVCVTGINLYFRIRHKFPVTVNCWFCNKDTDVPYGNRNCWDCPHCEQYNGFFQDGSYNKEIPAQHDELLNHPVQAVSNKIMKQKLVPTELNGNGLCRKCNINQELKIQQLAAFTPVHPAHYDEEVDQFRQHLERAYRLCSPCEEVLMKTLNKQKCTFLGVSLKQSCSIISTQKNGFLTACKTRMYRVMPSRLHLMSCFSILLAASLALATSYHLNKDDIPIPEIICNQTIWSYVPTLDEIFPYAEDLFPLIIKFEILLTAAGSLIQLLAVPTRKHKKIDFICASFWVLLHIQCWLLKWSQLEEYINLLDFNIIHVALAFITLLMCTCSALVPRQRFESKYYSTSRRARNLNCSSESFNLSSNSEDLSVSSDKDCHLFKDTTAKDNISPAKCVKEQDTSNLPSNVSRFVAISPSVRNKNVEQTGEDNSEDLDRGLGNLTLGTYAYNDLVEKKNISPSFKTKVYGQNIVDAFDDSPFTNLRNRKKPLIRPSQLNLSKNITQSSWVAGGYWQSPTHGRFVHVPRRETQDMPTGTGFVPLSRSSSQSSGFVSQSSQTDLYDGVATSLPNSRTGSICGGDFDRFSALSEPIYHYAATPVYFPNGRPPPYFGTPFYGGAPLIVPHPYGMMSPGFVSNYPLPQPRPALVHAQSYYPPQPSRPLSAVWNPSAFSSQPPKNPQGHSPADAHSRSSSQNSDECQSVTSEHSSNPKPRTLVSVIKENMFLAVLFCCSLLFNALILGGVMLGNGNLMLPRVI
ncbi:hypothetical protein L9F63_018393 [Diploptera punctata]|uniref:Ima1 N-terminal domain-containing protein n=1 Tax=Diploptera punctata TaxID=6984 RepID=A0AAD7ZWL0_DIPPU|nr:hypothetical protein L9F63_018393 [Diploptera punctata]